MNTGHGTLTCTPGLPPGISGIAELAECHIRYAASEQYWYVARGVVIEPKQYEGYSTIIEEPLFETQGGSRKRLGDHVAFMLNEVRKLGGDIKCMDLSQLEHLLATMQESKPRFHFRTWDLKGITVHHWDGVVDSQNDPQPTFVVG